MTFEPYFKGKRITVMGLGLLGRGVGDAEFLAQAGAEVTVTDMKTESQLLDSVRRLSMYDNVRFHLGGHLESDFTDTDMVIKGAGVPLNSPYIEAAKKAGVAVYMSTALFAKLATEEGATIVGVTGTRGKSTITQLIYRSLAHAAKPARYGGNVRGVSTLAMIAEVQKGDIAVLELDSWQLQGFGDLKVSPHVSVFSNLMPDHLNYYPDMETYFADKANIFRFQKPGDYLFVGDDILSKVQASNPPVAPQTVPPIPENWEVHLLGAHNRTNIALGVAALRALNLTEEEIRAGVETFHGVEGRLQFIKEVHGVKIYNDNNATTPEATIAALATMPKGKTVLIMGGADKGLDTTKMIEAVKSTCKEVILIEGSGTEKIRSQFPDAPVHEMLIQAVSDALKKAKAGDVILFSPGFASFGMFTNEYERNDLFLRIMQKL